MTGVDVCDLRKTHALTIAIVSLSKLSSRSMKYLPHGFRGYSEEMLPVGKLAAAHQ